MSTDTEHVEEGTEASVLETWTQWYYVPIVGVAMVFMLLSRLRAYDNFVRENGLPGYSGVDSWYHWRTIQWTAENFPHTMPFEVWTGFPTGQYSGQFGTLFDQLIVAAAMIVGLGDPSTETLYTVTLIAIPVIAALVAVPVFYMGRRLGGTLGGITSVILLALFPGEFLRRSLTGNIDHHIGEVLFMAIAVLSMMVALRVAEREKPIYELVAERDWDALRTPALYSALAGVGMGLYIWVWPAAILLVGIFGVFFAVHLSIDYVRGISPDHVAFVGVVSMTVTAVFAALLIEAPQAGVTNFGYLQPLLPLLVAVGCGFVAWFARQWDDFDVDRRFFPAAIGGLIVAAFVVMAIVLPDLFNTLYSNLTSRLLPIDQSDTALTVSEVQPPDDFTDRVFDEFGTAFYTMLAGLVLLVARPLLGREYRAEYTLVIVWALFLTGMAMTQARFLYYLALGVAVVNAVFFSDILRLFSLEQSVQTVRQIETYQVITLVLVALLLFVPLMPGMATTDAWAAGENTGMSGDAWTWEESTHWLEENTPQPGDWGGADNSSELDYYGNYEYPEGGDFDYPEGAYGVLSWWDYGHLITTQGERIPHSNPFQQHARSSSAFLTAQSEERAELILDAVAEGASVSDQTNEELREAIGDGGSHEDVRYVMIDYEMAGGKFSAISEWTGPGYGHYSIPEDYEDGETIPREEIRERFDELPFEETTLSRLYFDDGDEMDGYRLVHEDSQRSARFVSYAIINNGTDNLAQFQNGNPAVVANRQLTQQTQLQLSQYQQSEDLDVVILDDRQASSVKTFERVEGATIAGSVDQSVSEGAQAYATVELETETGRTFNYTQVGEIGDDGSFELTVPYPTLEELGVEDGYTNSSVLATGDYEVVVGTPEDGQIETEYAGEVSVPETDVVNGEDVEVTLEESADVIDDPTEDGQAEAGDGEDGDADDESEDNSTDNTSAENDSDANDTSDDNASSDDGADDEAPEANESDAALTPAVPPRG